MNLLEMTLQGGVLILVILLLRGLLRYRLPGWTFRILWGVALVRLLVPLTLPSQWSVYTGLDRLADRAETVQTAPAPQPGPSVIWTAPSEEPSHSDVPAAPSEPVPAPVPEGAAQTVPVKVPWHTSYGERERACWPWPLRSLMEEMWPFSAPLCP